MDESGYWYCPVCEWRVDDARYLLIVFDPWCEGCGVRRWSEYQYQERQGMEG